MFMLGGTLTTTCRRAGRSSAAVLVLVEVDIHPAPIPKLNKAAANAVDLTQAFMIEKIGRKSYRFDKAGVPLSRPTGRDHQITDAAMTVPARRRTGFAGASVRLT